MLRKKDEDGVIRLPEASGVAQMVKTLPTMQEQGFYPWVKKIPGEWNGYLSSVLAWKIPGTEKPGGLRSLGLQRVRHN